MPRNKTDSMDAKGNDGPSTSTAAIVLPVVYLQSSPKLVETKVDCNSDFQNPTIFSISIIIFIYYAVSRKDELEEEEEEEEKGGGNRRVRL